MPTFTFQIATPPEPIIEEDQEEDQEEKCFDAQMSDEECFIVDMHEPACFSTDGDDGGGWVTPPLFNPELDVPELEGQEFYQLFIGHFGEIYLAHSVEGGDHNEDRVSELAGIGGTYSYAVLRSVKIGQLQYRDLMGVFDDQESIIHFIVAGQYIINLVSFDASIVLPFEAGGGTLILDDPAHGQVVANWNTVSTVDGVDECGSNLSSLGKYFNTYDSLGIEHVATWSMQIRESINASGVADYNMLYSADETCGYYSEYGNVFLKSYEYWDYYDVWAWVQRNGTFPDIQGNMAYNRLIKNYLYALSTDGTKVYRFNMEEQLEILKNLPPSWTIRFGIHRGFANHTFVPDHTYEIDGGTDVTQWGVINEDIYYLKPTFEDRIFTSRKTPPEPDPQ